MKSKKLNILFIIVLTALLLMVFDGLTGKAGNLEPNAPPQPTMVTLNQLSAQLAALSSPVEKVVRGVITFGDGVVESQEDFSPAVDPNRCVVLLSGSVAFNRDTTPTYDKWLGRTSACLINLNSSQITVEVEDHQAEQKVSYQIIEYK